VVPTKNVVMVEVVVGKNKVMVSLVVRETCQL